MDDIGDLKKYFSDRNIDILRRRDGGETLRSIAASYNIGVKRVSDIIKKERDRPAKEAISKRIEICAKRRRDEWDTAIAAADIDRVPVKLLFLSIRASRRLDAAGFIWVGDVARASDIELCAIPGFGATSLNEVRGEIARMIAERSI